jgi:hypothetical protein
MKTPTTIISNANSGKRMRASVILPMAAPIAAPTYAGGGEHCIAQRHFTLPRRAWLMRLAKALIETAMALVPMATCGLATPTT